MIFEKLLKSSFRAIGADIRRLHNDPLHTLLGIGKLPIRTVFDIGANDGGFAGFIRRFFPTATIYSFEPLSEPYVKLCAYASKDGDLKAYNLALGDAEGTLDFILHSEHSPSSSFLQATEQGHAYWPVTKKQEEVSVSMTTLDAWFAEFGKSAEKDILVKLDVQGFEDRVIRGGLSVFAIASVAIVEVCIDLLYTEQADFFEITKMLHEQGLKYVGNLSQIHAADGHVIYIDAVFVRS